MAESLNRFFLLFHPILPTTVSNEVHPYYLLTHYRGAQICKCWFRSKFTNLLPRFLAISSKLSCVCNALKVALTTLNWLRFPCDLAVQSLIPILLRISSTSGCPCNPLPADVARNVTLHELCLPTRSRVNPLPK